LKIHDCIDPFFNRNLAEIIAKRGINTALSFHADQRKRSVDILQKSYEQNVRRTFLLAESRFVTKIAILVPSRNHSIEVRRTYTRGLL
jgi:hypothetical protein